VFGTLIALVAGHCGLRGTPGRADKATARAVVAAITLVLAADAVFAVALSGVGLHGGVR
jgi:phospholipid/cholesterol/gamma-HCH transport system permease protein